MIEDLLRSVRATYYSMPQSAKRIVGTTYRRGLTDRLRWGAKYKEFSDLLDVSESWNNQQMLDYQFRQLKATIQTAEKYIPYYQRVFSDWGVSSKDLRSPEDIAAFPTLSKQDVKDHFPDLVNRHVPGWRRLITTTGGSTAEPMRFIQVKGLTRSKERAFISHGWRRVGYRPGMRAVQLRGRSVGIPERGTHWEYEPIQNILEMDSSYLTEDRIPKYLKAIEEFGADYLIGFPSSVAMLAKYLTHSGYSPPSFKAIMLVSENLYPWQRQNIEDAFACRTFSHYGHSEMVLLGMEGARTHDLLFFPQYGYMETLHNRGASLQDPAKLYELVGTSFHNPAMPFIRYRTQDYGIRTQPDPELPYYPALSHVEGRLQEFIVTADKRLISICTMGAAHFDVFDQVSETQYFQDTPGAIEFRVVPRSGYSDRDRQAIQRRISEKTGPEVRVVVREVKSIDRPASGKHMMLVQRLPVTDLQRLMSKPRGHRSKS